jgi:hypothetical protein
VLLYSYSGSVCSPKLSHRFNEEHLKNLDGGVVRHRHGRRRGPHFRTKFLVWLLFAAAAAITWQFARQQPVSSLSYLSPEASRVGLGEMREDQFGLASRAEPSSIATRPGRPVYLYSIIPGGIQSAEELQHVVEHDPVAAQHFRGFDYQRARLVEVAQKQSMYVSYRIGDKVYWTRKKVSLRPGETLISDGKIVARTRCGNRVALAPLGPPALLDPLELDLDQPLFSNDMLTREVDPQAESYATSLPPPATANTVQPTRGKRLIPLFFLPFAALPGGSSHAPLAVTPEPGTMLLLSTGLAGVYWRVRQSRRRR